MTDYHSIHMLSLNLYMSVEQLCSSFYEYSKYRTVNYYNLQALPNFKNCF